MSNLIAINPLTPEVWLIEKAVALLRAGGIVAFPTETVYGLGGDALNPVAIQKIFTAKQRPDWDPLIVHVTGIEMARTLTIDQPAAFEILANTFWPGPLTMVMRQASHVPKEITAGRDTVALRMPRHPVIAALLGTADLPIAAPSANLFGRPSPTCAQHVADDLGDTVDLILDGGRTPLGVESTVLDLTQHPAAILRPGGVAREHIEDVIGDIVVVAYGAESRVDEGLMSPGMSVKHYAPRAAMELFETAAVMEARATALKRDGKRVATIACDGNLEQYAHDLFALLRRFDDEQVDVILAEVPPPQGLGLAIRDRLQRASGLALG